MLRNPELKSRFHNAGLDAKGGSPEVFGAFIRSEIDKYAKVVKLAGVSRQ